MIYPIEYGYKVSAEILRDTETNTAQIKIHAPFYKNKEYMLSFFFKSSDFTDAQILKDHNFIARMLQSYGRGIK